VIRLFLSGLFLGLFAPLFAQESIPLGTWRVHVSYFQATKAIPAGTSTVAAATNGLVVIPSQGSPTTITRLDGLSDTGISALGWYASGQTLITAYSSGNIDLITDRTLINLRGIITANITGSRKINGVTVVGNRAWMPADFGMVVLDLALPALREVYRNLGPNGTNLRLNEAVVLHDSLFVATAQGIIAGSLSPSANLADFNQWKRMGTDQGLPAGEVPTLTLWNGTLYCAIPGNDIYRYQEGQWVPTGWMEGSTLHRLTSRGTHLLAFANGPVSKINVEGGITLLENEVLRQPVDGYEAPDGKIWLADGEAGPLSWQQGVVTSHAPSGPFTDKVYKLAVFGNKAFALPGGRASGISPLGQRLGYSHFEKGAWTNFNEWGLTEPFPDFRDVVDVWHDPATHRTWFASFGDGLLLRDANGYQQVTDQTPGSPLLNALPPNRYVQITSLLHDGQGLWMTNHGVNPSLHYLSNSGVWESYSFATAAAHFPLGMAMPVRDRVWMRLNPDFGGGIMVLDKPTGQTRYLTTDPNQGNLPDRNVNAMIVDRRGHVWIGTDRGVVYFNNPASTMGASAVNAIRPIFDNRALLRDERITALRSDGGNRKWIGTPNGLWLFSENGERLVHQFTTANSPLLSNHILSIDIDEQSGEVFIGTTAGIVSYRGTGTTGKAVHQNVKIFPNPVRPEFQGLVGISGLANGAIVKVTDVAGKLVYEGRAEGSTFAWNVADLQGRRVATGMYFVWSTTEDGTDSFVGKIAVIN
jgi:hypothetical protein